MKSAGYSEHLVYNKNSHKGPKTQRNRSRKVIWFNPPFCQTVKTNIGSKFLFLIDEHFKGTNLAKYFNRSTMKLSYSCLPNVDKIISGHNKKILESQKTTATTEKSLCNCRGKDPCPLDGKCLTSSIVYKAEVNTMVQDGQENSSKIYIGTAATTFKDRYANHKSSFKHYKDRNKTALSKYVWQLKSNDVPFKISWSIMGKASTYSPSKKFCSLCNLEKTLILFSDENNSLNKRNELMSSCRHRAKHLLSSQQMT